MAMGLMIVQEARPSYQQSALPDVFAPFWAGVRAVRLMTWQERLATLRDLGRWDHALLMGLTLLDAAQVLLTITSTLSRNLNGCTSQKEALAWSFSLEAWDYVNICLK